MPTYAIKAPNGKTYHIDGPAGATDEQVRAEVTRQFPDAIKAAPQQQAPKPKPAPQAPQPHDYNLRDFAGDLGYLGARGTTGVTGLIDYGTSLLGAAAGYGVQGAGRVVGAAQDALGFDGASTVRGADRYASGLKKPVTLSGLVQGIAPKPSNNYVRALGDVAEFTGGMVSPLNKFLPTPKAAPPAFPKAPPVATSDVVTEGSKRGVRVMTSDVIPPKTNVGKFARKLGENIPFAGTSGPRSAQASERVAAVQNFVDSYGANSGALEGVTENLLKTRGTTIGKLTAAKTNIIEGIGGNVPLDRTITKINEKIADLTAKNSEAYAPFIEKLESFKRQFSQGKTLAYMEDNRKLLGQLFTDTNLATVKTGGQKALNEIYAPLNADLGTYIRNKAGAQAFQTWKGANTKLSAMAGELDNRALKGVLRDAESTPENVAKLLFSQKPSDVARLYQNLSPAGRVRAQSAIIHRATEKAQSLAPDGTDVISPEKFVNNLKNLSKQLGVFFKGSDAQSVEGLTRLINATRQAGIANVNPNNGAQLVPFAVGSTFTSAGAMVGGPVLGSAVGAGLAGTTGLLARAYESAPVRNLLLQLAKSPKGSKAESALLVRLGTTISAMSNQTKTATPLNDNISSAAAASDGKEQHQQ